MDKSKLPKVDLSKYNSVERLDSSIEQIVLQALICFDCEVKKVSKHLKLDEEIVNIIFIKYYAQLCKILESKDKGKDTEDAIDTTITLYKNHIKEVADIVNRNPNSKLLSEKVVTSLNRITDRLTDIKEQEVKSYESTVNNLFNTIIRQKQLEVVENGKVEDNSDYLENIQTVSQKILNLTGAKGGPTKKVRVTFADTNNSMIYPSLSIACMNNPEWKYTAVSRAITGQDGRKEERKGWYKGCYFEYIEDEQDDGVFREN